MQPPDTKPPLPGVRAWLVLLAVVLAALHPALQAGFLNFDDGFFFGGGSDAAALRDGGLALVLDPTRTIANAYLPVSHLSLWFDRVVVDAGIGAWWPHLHSLLLHAAVAFVLARLLVRLGCLPQLAVAAAACFAVHPALVESAAWVSSRKDLLSGLFALACLAAVTDRAVARATICAALAIYSKGTASALLLLVPLLLWYLRRRPGREALLVLGVVLCGSLHHAAIAAAEGTLADVDRGQRLLALPGLLLHYLRVIVWPGGLNVLYPAEAMLAQAAGLLLPALALLAGLLIASGYALRNERTRAPGFAALLLLAALAPCNSVWPASSIAVADRYLYLAMPWAALLLAGLLARVPYGPVVAWVLAGVLGLLAYERSREFRSSERLWEASLCADPANAVALLNLADAVSSDGARVRALALEAVLHARRPEHRLRAHKFVREIDLRSGDVGSAASHALRAFAAAADLPPSAEAELAWRDAGLLAATILAAADRPADVARVTGELIGRMPHDPEVLVLQAEQRIPAQGRGAELTPADAEAVAALLERAARGGPPNARYEIVRARLELARGNLLRAVAHCRRARELQPAAVAAWLHEADIYHQQGLYPQAENVIREGMAAGLRDPNLLTRLGLALVAQNRLPEARERYEEYLQLRPRDQDVARLLALVLLAQAEARFVQAEPAEIDALLTRARELAPGLPRIDAVAGRLAYRGRDLPAAIELLERAHAADPEDPEIRRVLAEAHRDRGNQLLLGDQEQSLRHLRRFLDLDVAELPQDASRTTLQNGWKRIEARGIERFQARDFAAAAAAFRLCLELMPQQQSARFQLGLVLYEQGTDLEQALACFDAAERWQREQQLDPSLPLLYALQTLGRLGRSEQALARGEAFLREGLAPEPMAARIELAMKRLAR